MSTGTDWLGDWWAGVRAADRAARLEAEAADPGVPVWYGTATGAPTPHPWSAVAGATHRIPSGQRFGRLPSAVMNLDKLHRQVLELLGVEP